jgi:hypothetical protein
MESNKQSRLQERTSVQYEAMPRDNMEISRNATLNCEIALMDIRICLN